MPSAACLPLPSQVVQSLNDTRSLVFFNNHYLGQLPVHFARSMTFVMSRGDFTLNQVQDNSFRPEQNKCYPSESHLSSLTGKQGWHNGERACLPLMWLRFSSGQVSLLLVLVLAPRVFFGLSKPDISSSVNYSNSVAPAAEGRHAQPHNL